jgi:hypothetical protein
MVALWADAVTAARQPYRELLDLEKPWRIIFA